MPPQMCYISTMSKLKYEAQAFCALMNMVRLTVYISRASLCLSYQIHYKALQSNFKPKNSLSQVQG